MSFYLVQPWGRDTYRQAIHETTEALCRSLLPRGHGAFFMPVDIRNNGSIIDAIRIDRVRSQTEDGHDSRQCSPVHQYLRHWCRFLRESGYKKEEVCLSGRRGYFVRGPTRSSERTLDCSFWMTNWRLSRG